MDKRQELEFPDRPRIARRPGSPWLFALALLGLGVLAYFNGLRGPFILDDVLALVEDTSTRDWGTALHPPKDLTISGRPVLALSLVANYKVGGLDPFGYHVVNVAIHCASALVLFGLVAGTLNLDSNSERLRRDAQLLGFAAAGIWVVHPLCTQAVTYTIQRAESLMAFFYLVTLWAHLKAVRSSRPLFWHALSFGSCILGMGTKEVMVSAPVAVLYFDSVFVSGSLRETIRRRWRPLLALFATWLLLLWLVMSLGGNRGGTTGPADGGMWLAYWLTQALALTTYLRLTFWPSSLTLDYGAFWLSGPKEVAWEIALIVILCGAAVWTMIKKPKAGFVAWFFFAILAPTSIMPGAIQMIAEHRMYLALPAICVLGILGLHAAAGRRALWILVPIACGLVVVTHERNKDYRTELEIWSDTVAKRPLGTMARNNLGIALLNTPGRTADAVEQFREVLKLVPGHGRAQLNLALSLLQIPGSEAEGVALLEKLVHEDPHDDRAKHNLAVAYSKQPSRIPEAIRLWSEVLERHPKWQDAHSALGAILVARDGDRNEGLKHLRTAVALHPGHTQAAYNLGVQLTEDPSTVIEGLGILRELVKLHPDHHDAHVALGIILSQSQVDAAEAMQHFQQASNLRPGSLDDHFNLGTFLSRFPEKRGEAIREFEACLRINPSDTPSHEALTALRAKQ